MPAITIQNKYPGSCKKCDGKVGVGTYVVWTPGEKGVTHKICPETMGPTSPIKIKKKIELGNFTKVKGFDNLFDHQKEAVNAVKAGHDRLYLGWEPGLGKTLAALVAAEVKKDYPLIVLCPSVVKINWQRETEHWVGRSAQVLSGRKPYELTGDVIIINYDILSYWQDALIEYGPKGVVIDESHYVKNPDTKRTKAARSITDAADGMIFALSGTPTPNSVYDLVQPLTMLDVIKDFGGPRAYIKRYCPPVQTQWGTSYKRARNLGELHTNLKNTCFIRRTKEECLDLPDLTVVDIPVSVQGGADDFYTPLLAQMSSGTLRQAKKAIAAVERSSTKSMIAAERASAGSAKIDSIVELARDINDPLVIMVHHREVQQAVAKALKKTRTVSVLTGGMTDRRRQEAIDDFQGGKSDVIVCSITAAGIGINLQRGQAMILGELPMTYAEIDQAISRCHRSGQKNNLTVYRVIGVDTFDEVLLKVVGKKEVTSARVEDGKEVTATSADDLIAARLLALYQAR